MSRRQQNTRESEQEYNQFMDSFTMLLSCLLLICVTEHHEIHPDKLSGELCCFLVCKKFVSKPTACPTGKAVFNVNKVHVWSVVHNFIGLHVCMLFRPEI